MAFKSILGQGQAIEVLSSALKNKRVPHAYLFVGPEGTGKRTAALKWAMVLNCRKPVSETEACEVCPSCAKVAAGNHPDVLQINFAYQAMVLKEPLEKQRVLKIGTIREMEHTLRLKPMEGRVKVAILDPADKLVEEAAHALLKILEEPPALTHLALLTLDAGQMLGTIRSRCQWVRFRPLPQSTVEQVLLRDRLGMTEEDARRAALQSEGSLSRAIAFLEEDQLETFDWESAPLSELMNWCEQFHNKTGRAAAEIFLRRLLARFQSELYANAADAALREIASQNAKRALQALRQLKQYVSPQLILEVMLLKIRREARQRQTMVGT